MNDNADRSVLNYYKSREFNPVPISLDTEKKWILHRKKRINLLQNHLCIPLHLLKDKHVLEFGCNSGENALVLADFGARLTLVEPNEQVIPRLKANFKAMNLEKQIHELSITGIEDYKIKESFDLVIAEGFLNTIRNRDELLEMLLGMCKKGGMVIINYDDRYGGYFELLKSCVLKTAWHSDSIGFRSQSSLILAKQLFHKSFDLLNTSRPFEAWWEDQLVNPFASCIWSLDEILKIAEKLNFSCYSNSPVLKNPNLFQWYKDVADASDQNSRIMQFWRESFAYILSGENDQWCNFIPAEKNVIQTLFDHTSTLANYIADDNAKEFTISFPSEIKKFFNSQVSQYFHTLSDELENLYSVLNHSSSKEIIEQYTNSSTLQKTWGTVLHYVCLMKN